MWIVWLVASGTHTPGQRQPIAEFPAQVDEKHYAMTMCQSVVKRLNSIPDQPIAYYCQESVATP
jgi:hypothetical protein